MRGAPLSNTPADLKQANNLLGVFFCFFFSKENALIIKRFTKPRDTLFFLFHRKKITLYGQMNIFNIYQFHGGNSHTQAENKKRTV